MVSIDCYHEKDPLFIALKINSNSDQFMYMGLGAGIFTFGLLLTVGLIVACVWYCRGER